MRILIEPTVELVDLDGVRTRHWTGVTDDGVRCHVFVHSIAVAPSEDATKFIAELESTTQPGNLVVLGTVLP